MCHSEGSPLNSKCLFYHFLNPSLRLPPAVYALSLPSEGQHAAALWPIPCCASKGVKIWRRIKTEEARARATSEPKSLQIRVRQHFLFLFFSDTQKKKRARERAELGHLDPASCCRTKESLSCSVPGASLAWYAEWCRKSDALYLGSFKLS